MKTISVEDADEHAFEAAVDRTKRMLLGEHRWYDQYLVVFEDHDGWWGFLYNEPASEMQEDDDNFPEEKDGQVPVQRVEPYEVSVTHWRVIS